MPLEKTLSIIKPDATSKNVIGKIIDRFETNGLKVVAGKLMHMDHSKAAGFYAEHSERPFFPNLVEYMTSAPARVALSLKQDFITCMTNCAIGKCGSLNGIYQKTLRNAWNIRTQLYQLPPRFKGSQVARC